MKFGINNMIINKHTNEKGMVVNIDFDAVLPVYVIEYDETGDTFRMNTDYEEHWDVVN